MAEKITAITKTL